MNPIALYAPALSPDLRDSIRQAHALGYTAVQLDVTASNLPLQSLPKSAQRELRKFLADHNTTLVSLSTSAGKKGFSPGADIDRALDHLTRSLEAAADLGRVPLCIDLGPLPPPPVEAEKPKPPIDPLLLGALILPPPKTENRISNPAPRDEKFESTLGAALHELGRRADKFGTLLAFRSDLGALASLHRALTQAACPFFSLDLDPVAILHDTAASGGGWDLETTLSHFAGRIAHVRLRDALKGTAGRTQPTPLGQGSINLPNLLQSLDAAGYAGPLTFDPTDLRDRAAGAASALTTFNRYLTA